MASVAKKPMSHTRYELPAEGISLLGYIVRRMHKTMRLMAVEDSLAQGRPTEALTQIALYAAEASTSFGIAHYQPHFNHVGEAIEEADPETGVKVSARLETDKPHYCVACTVQLPHGAVFASVEEITGTTISLHGLGMPAPSRFNFTSLAFEYTAQLNGVLTSELTLGWLGQTRIRAYGHLKFDDTLGNKGHLMLKRHGEVTVGLTSVDGLHLTSTENWAQSA